MDNMKNDFSFQSKPVAIYVTSATDFGPSYGRQIEACRDYSEAHFPGHPHVLFAESGISGLMPERHELLKLKQAIASGDILVVVTKNLDRISRKSPRYMHLLGFLGRQ
jgi:DNA invertase Pin-like site-specific DNA recombinase